MVFGNREVTASPIYDESGNPIASILGSDGVRRLQVDGTRNPRDFICQQFSETTAPAILVSSSAGPYLIGGQSLTIAVDGAAAVAIPFAVRAQSDGTSISGPNTSTFTGNGEKLRVSIDGGLVDGIKIGKNLPDGLTIAANIQTKIRANVPNGAAVTVVFNNPGYTITSGTIGVGSSVVVTSDPNPAKDVAALLGLGVANGGLESIGQVANTYSSGEVIAILDAAIPSTVSALDAFQKINITTNSRGASASLLVTAGGANTALGFTTTLVTGSAGGGSAVLAVDGSATERPFSVAQHASRIFVVGRLVIRLRGSPMTLGKFGTVAALANGLLIHIKSGNEPASDFDTFRTNADMMGRAVRSSIVAGGVGEDDLMFAHFEFSEGVKIRPGSLDEFTLTIRDNLTGLTEFSAYAEGHLI